MTETATISSLTTLFKFPFHNKELRSRFVVGMVLHFANVVIPILPSIFISGYMLRVMRQAIRGEALNLPAWDDWGGLFMDGLRRMVVSLVYTLPGILILTGGMVLYIGSLVSLPFLIDPAGGSSEVATGSLMWVLVSLAIFFFSMLIGPVFFLLGAIPLPMATAHFVEKDQVSAAFRVREWWPLLKANRWGYFIAWVVMVGLGAMLGFMIMAAYYSFVLCCLIPFVSAFVAFYLSLVGAALFGVTYRESVEIHSAGAVLEAS